LFTHLLPVQVCTANLVRGRLPRSLYDAIKTEL
jgi:hypothetical protein